MENASGIDKFLTKAANIFSDYELTRFTDSKGFSLIGKYGVGEKRQMGIIGTSDIVPFSKFYFLDEDINEQSEYISLKVRIASTVKERSGGNVRYVPDVSRFKIRPIEFTASDEFYIKRSTGAVYEKKRGHYVRINLEDLYKRVYKAHVSSFFSPAGLYRRMKIFTLRTLPHSSFSLVSWVCGLIFWWLKGKRYQFDVIAQALLDQREDEISKRSSESPEESIDFFGYKVGVWTLTTFSIVVIAVFSILKDNPALKLPDSNVLSTIYGLSVAIVAIVFYDKALPKSLKYVIEGAENRAFHLRYSGVRFKI